MRIAVIGGGLGGIPVGILLQRAGHDVTVYEQASKLERIGAGIHLFPNAGKVLQELGLFDRLANVGLVPDRMWHREWDTGKVTFEVRMDRFLKLFGVPHLIIHRGDLVEILASGLETGSFVFGKRLIGFEDDGRMVSLSFSDGSNSEAEIVIGADGINSVIRATLLGPEQPTYTGHVAHRAIFPIERLGDLQSGGPMTATSSPIFQMRRRTKFTSSQASRKYGEMTTLRLLQQTWTHCWMHFKDFTPRFKRLLKPRSVA